MENKSVISVGPMFLLFLLFLGLKLTNYISWSWLWITVPLWGPLVLFICISIIIMIIFLIIGIVATLLNK